LIYSYLIAIFKYEKIGLAKISQNIPAFP